MFLLHHLIRPALKIMNYVFFNNHEDRASYTLSRSTHYPAQIVAMLSIQN